MIPAPKPPNLDFIQDDLSTKRCFWAMRLNNPMPQLFNTPILWAQVCVNTILNHGLEWFLLLGGWDL
jgi:hypothetical protein